MKNFILSAFILFAAPTGLLHAQGNLVIMNNTDCPVYYNILAHEAGGGCYDLQLSSVNSTAAWTNDTYINFSTAPFWQETFPPFSVYPGDSLSTPAYWDAFKFGIGDIPGCEGGIAVGSCGGVPTTWVSDCPPCSGNPTANIYVTWVTVFSVVYVIINY